MTARFLGCPNEYAAFITDNTYRNRLEVVRFSSLEWERVLDEISSASVTLPDALGGPDCCARLGGIRTWRYGLLIERDSEEVWQGPITTIRRYRDASGDGLRLTASDVWARMRKRLVTRGPGITSFSAEDSGVVLQAIVNEMAHLSSDPFELRCPEFTTGALMSRDYDPFDFELAWPAMQEILNSSADAYVQNGVMHVWRPGVGWIYSTPGPVGEPVSVIVEGDYTSTSELYYSLFTEESWTSQPEWSISGDAEANAVWVPGADASDTGQFWYAQDLESQQEAGVLDFVDDEIPAELLEEEPAIPEIIFQRHADSLLALRHIAPAVVEGGALSQKAPVAINDLRPGSLWFLDVFDACYGQLLAGARLKRVKVDVSVGNDGLTETVKPTLQPPGWEGGDG